MKCDCCGKLVKTLFKTSFRRDNGCELVLYYCPKCYKKLKKSEKK